MKKEITINGNNFSDQNGFDLEMKNKITKNVDWIDYSHSRGINLDSLNDFLRGGFGVVEYEESFKLIWLNSKKSEKDLGQELFKKIIEIIKDHSHIELILS